MPPEQNTLALPAKQSFLKRFYIYQKERFPFLVHGLLVLSFSFSAASYSRICRGAPGFIPWHVFLPGVFITVTLFFLVRVFDEFKDADEDAAFRSYLPVPRGVISLRELMYAGFVTAALQIIVILVFFPAMLWLYALVIGYLLLMGKEFFVSRWLKRHQITYVTSHMFIIPLIDCFASGLDWHLNHVPAPTGLLFFFGVSYMNGIVLEFGRKLRTKDNEENGVLTYSKMYGEQKAAFIWICTLAFTLVLSLAASWFAELGLIAYVLLPLFFLSCCIPALIFMWKPTKRLSKSIEICSALWTMAMYFTLGAAPMIGKLIAGQ